MLAYWIEPDRDGDKLHHLRCCHGILRRPEENETNYQKRLEEWAPPFWATVEKAIDNMGVDNPPNPPEWVQKKQIKDAYHAAKRTEAHYFNENGDVHDVARLHTHEDYSKGIVIPFDEKVKRLKENPNEKKCATVLDCFAGVGTGILVLKKLGIAIKKIIYVEHDNVARHVYRSHHDSSYYNEDDGDGGNGKPHADDGIEHVYEYDTWESMVSSDEDEDADPSLEDEQEPSSTAPKKPKLSQEKIKALVDKHGPIDIILGGPPCIDYSKVNAYREGVEGLQGSYLTNFGRFIRLVERIQTPKPLYFLAENVIVSGMDKDEINDAFGFDWDPVNVDAKDLSPARRNRDFWTNIPLDNLDYTTGSGIDPSTCLEEGYVLPGQIVEPEIHVKSNCIMASLGRQDEKASLRMYCFQSERNGGKEYIGRPLSMAERERFMGYPEGYIEKPGTMLFVDIL